MGAEQFMTMETGDSIAAAFGTAVDKARYEYGHRGYTGTIAEKDSFINLTPGLTPLDRADAQALVGRYLSAWRMAEADRPERWAEIDDKWGPAGAIEVKSDQGETRAWLFFGWASS